MQITSEEAGSGGRYTGRVEGIPEPAIMTFSRASPTLIIIDHTEVPGAMRGTGAGQALAEHAVAEARRGGWKIIPLCPFMKAQMDRHPDWNDARQ
ncbi:putative GNAT family acetyltransferase [Peteryoungia aggregata LMG 23059]|uniref:GNAT family acetyltransferase n=1 Tax=Peteryoungia aggregata LMG 23059 TaxID=1368425 RepID=A0ABU0GAA3_9HYPH|nr:GNAT family N-acetyltransferase [Peteryoungia aggregata]MDQ0422033.1 putative GNAT family acetyltransferase [Peteryoungia aggregata LMG 23059]